MERAAQLQRMTKAALVQMCRTGVRRPDGGRTQIEGGYAPVRDWSKDDIVNSILAVEFPAPGDER
jgi:hypothetical protein